METITIGIKEREVLALVSAGYSSREIAERTCKSIHTVTAQRKKLLKKLGAGNSAELIKKASDNKLLPRNGLRNHTAVQFDQNNG